jgi:hypothetical protein
MGQRGLSAGHQTVAQLNYFRNGYYTLRVLLAVRQLYQELEDLFDQFVGKPVEFLSVKDDTHDATTYGICPSSMYSNCFKTKPIKICSESSRQ